jgi:hypothetical protein
MYNCTLCNKGFDSNFLLESHIRECKEDDYMIMENKIKYLEEKKVKLRKQYVKKLAKIKFENEISINEQKNKYESEIKRLEKIVNENLIIINKKSKDIEGLEKEVENYLHKCDIMVKEHIKERDNDLILHKEELENMMSSFSTEKEDIQNSFNLRLNSIELKNNELVNNNNKLSVSLSEKLKKLDEANGNNNILKDNIKELTSKLNSINQKNKIMTEESKKQCISHIEEKNKLKKEIDKIESTLSVKLKILSTLTDNLRNCNNEKNLIEQKYMEELATIKDRYSLEINKLLFEIKDNNDKNKTNSDILEEEIKKLKNEIRNKNSEITKLEKKITTQQIDVDKKINKIKSHYTNLLKINKDNNEKIKKELKDEIQDRDERIEQLNKKLFNPKL